MCTMVLLSMISYHTKAVLDMWHSKDGYNQSVSMTMAFWIGVLHFIVREEGHDNVRSGRRHSRTADDGFTKQ